MGVPRTHIFLWFLAALGVYLYLFDGPNISSSVRSTTVANHPAGVLRGVSSILATVLPAVLHFLLWAFALLIVFMAALALYRYYMRERRAKHMRTVEVVLGPDDTATPYEVMSALDAIHGQMLTRYVGAAQGQNSMTFEIVRKADGRVHFILAAPYEWIKAIEDVWRSKYTNIRFVDWTDTRRPWPWAQQIVLTKHWRHATETVKDYQNSVVETMVQSLDQAEGECHLQYLLTPVPMEPMNAQLRQHIQGIEQQAKQQQTSDPSNPGVGYAQSQMVKDALQLYGKSVFRTEIRLAADSMDLVQRVYGALREANGENTFRATTVVAAKTLWTRWFYLRMPSLGIFRSNLMFSFPLATIIHLPTARLRVNSLNRMLVRRGPAPFAIPRDEDLALMRDENGTVGIPEGDRKYNVLFIGSQGSGKTTGLENLVKIDTRYKDAHGQPKCVFLLDIGKDTAKRALGVVPPERKVIWFDPSDPECPWTVNPMVVSINESVLADNVLEGLTQVFGEEAIRYRSREFLGNAIMAVKDVLGQRTDFTHVYQLLTDANFRNRIIQNVHDTHQKQYWQITFTNMENNNPRFIEEGLAAPRNKLDEVLRNPLIRAALEANPARRQINMQEIVEGRAVFVANLDKSKLGKTGARLLGILLITMLWHALQAQNDVPESERIPVSIIIDEAQNFISEGFLDILAEGRAYGAQTAVAVRFLGEIMSDKVIKGLQALVQNLLIYQFELLDEAEDFMKRFMRVYANMVQINAESQDAINFGADDFMRLPKFQAVCRFMVDGSPTQAFLAQTIPWEQFYSEEARRRHLAEQPRRLALPAGDGEEVVVRPPNSDAAAQPMAVTSPAAMAPAPLPEPPAVVLQPSASSSSGTPAPGQPPEGGDGFGGSSALTLLDMLLGKDAAARLLSAAQDGMTGLLSRPTWDKAKDTIPQTGNTIVFFDVDDLKKTNDEKGHDVGDLLLKTAAQALKTLARQDDLAIRYGGDEFVLVMRSMTEADFPAWGQRAREAFRAVGVGVSIGGAVQRPGEALDEAMHRADQKMYEDKRKRKAGRDSGGGAHGMPPEGREAARPATRPAAQPKQAEAQWKKDDPRLVVCDKYNVTPQRLIALARELGATDHELRESCKWVLENRVAPEAAQMRLKRVLTLKVEDRLLRPVAVRLDCDLKALREAILAVDGTVEQAIEAVEKAPAIHTIAEMQDALMAGPSVAVRDGGVSM
ncbi:MAG: diguanylate cyclase [Thermaerobacter sp.]|nr:diguanylate cyclase [Thermaerobacter sp.]